MYSGIIQGTAIVAKIQKKQDLNSIVIQTPEGFIDNVSMGASISINGVCLTVSHFSDNEVAFDVMKETLSVTTLDSLKEGESVHFERSLRVGDENGGHEVSGHIDTTATVSEIKRTPENISLTFSLEQRWMRYLFRKGFIAIHGVSLTIADVEKKKGCFTVWLIPETRRRTIFDVLQKGDKVNIEINRTTQTIVDTVQEYLKECAPSLLNN